MSELTLANAAREVGRLNRMLAEEGDPAELNLLAADAGLLWAELKRRHAELEAERKPLQLAIRDELMAAGAKKTEAEEQARADERYTAATSAITGWEFVRDQAEVLYSAIKQRAYLLSRTVTVEA